MELIRQAREAVGLFAGAMPITPQQAWEEALDRMRKLSQGRCWACMAKEASEGDMTRPSPFTLEDRHDFWQMLRTLMEAARSNSERWFPRWHDGSCGMPLRVGYALGLAGEVGEVANVIKKLQRDGDSTEQQENLGAELADCFVYLLLLADECDVDLLLEYERKVEVNRERWENRNAG